MTDHQHPLDVVDTSCIDWHATHDDPSPTWPFSLGVLAGFVVCLAMITVCCLL